MLIPKDKELQNILDSLDGILDFSYECVDGDEEQEQFINDTQDRLIKYLIKKGLFEEI